MSRAEDLPSEILDRILFYVASDSYHSAGYVTNKDGLCACSLTCRYWAERTAPALFDTIVLQSQDDLNLLLSILTSNRKRLSDHILAIHIMHNEQPGEPQHPWIHLVLFSLAHRLPNLRNMVYADESGQRKDHSHPHPLLPKRFPALFATFDSVQELWIHDERLHSFQDLVCLVSRLPALSTLSCAQLYWTHQASRMPAERMRTLSHLRTVNILQSRAAWPFIWLFTSPAVSPRSRSTIPTDEDPHLALAPHDADVINDITQFFLSDKFASSTLTLEQADEQSWILKLANSAANVAPDAPSSEIPCVPDITFILNMHITPASSHETPSSNSLYACQLEKIELDRCRDVSNPYRTDWLTSLAWDRLWTILIEAGMGNVEVNVRLSAENIHQVTALQQLEDVMLSKLHPTEHADIDQQTQPRVVIHRDGWERQRARSDSMETVRP